jgi:hypothetical protein
VASIANISVESPSPALEAAAQSLVDALFDILYDLVPVLLQDIGADFIEASYGTVRGTNDAFISLEVSPIVFDLQLRAALRARGLDLPDRNGSHVRS